MDFIKVKNKHILFEYTDMSDSVFRAWQKVMALTAFMESMPTREQMLVHVHHATLKSLDEVLKKHGCSLDEVLMKVLCDADDVKMKREAWKKKQKEKRARLQNVSGDVPEDVSPKRREEKRREEKNKERKDIAPHVSKQKISFDGTRFQNIPEPLMEKWRQMAPGVSVPQEIAKAEAWAMTNPTKRKSNWARFLTTWITKAQDAPKPYATSGGQHGRPYQHRGRIEPEIPADVLGDLAEINRLSAARRARQSQEAANGGDTENARQDRGGVP